MEEKIEVKIEGRNKSAFAFWKARTMGLYSEFLCKRHYKTLGYKIAKMMTPEGKANWHEVPDALGDKEKEVWSVLEEIAGIMKKRSA